MWPMGLLFVYLLSDSTESGGIKLIIHKQISFNFMIFEMHFKVLN